MGSQREHLVYTLALLAVVLLLVLVPPALFERLPSVCLHRWLFGALGVRGSGYCPGCGSLRALSHLFHGNLGRAVGFNVNCLATGPVILFLLFRNVCRLVVPARRARGSDSPARTRP